MFGRRMVGVGNDSTTSSSRLPDTVSSGWGKNGGDDDGGHVYFYIFVCQVFLDRQDIIRLLFTLDDSVVDSPVFVAVRGVLLTPLLRLFRARWKGVCHGRRLYSIVSYRILSYRILSYHIVSCLSCPASTNGGTIPSPVLDLSTTYSRTWVLSLPPCPPDFPFPFRVLPFSPSYRSWYRTRIETTRDEGK